MEEKLMNEQTVEAVETAMTETSLKGLKVAAGAGAAVVVGIVTYKYAVKPLVAKIKSKRDEKCKVIAEEAACEYECDSCEEI